MTPALMRLFKSRTGVGQIPRRKRKSLPRIPSVREEYAMRRARLRDNGFAAKYTSSSSQRSTMQLNEKVLQRRLTWMRDMRLLDRSSSLVDRKYVYNNGVIDELFGQDQSSNSAGSSSTEEDNNDVMDKHIVNNADDDEYAEDDDDDQADGNDKDDCEEEEDAFMKSTDPEEGASDYDVDVYDELDLC